MRLHHVQVAMPAGQEQTARAFYRDALGLIEVPKPGELAARGGCWFQVVAGSVVTAELHLGVEDPFVPAGKAHPALLVESVAELDALGERVAAAGFPVSWAERDTLEGFARFHCRDGFGNRVEVLAELAG